MDDPRYDSEAIRAYLLGGGWVQQNVTGLLPRTRATALAAYVLPLPSVPGSFGSIIGYRPERVQPNSKPDFPLTLGQGEPHNLYDTLFALAAFLDDWLGTYPDRQVFLSQLFDRATSEIDRLTHPSRPHIPTEDLDRCIDLITGLLEWSGTSCVHSFRPERPDAQGDYEAKCDLCGFHFVQAGWLPQAPLARCEICEAPLARHNEGRARHTCSEKCKKARQRKAPA